MEINSTILECALGQWGPKMGDPNIMGWLTVVAYGVSAIIAYMVARKKDFPLDSKHREVAFWWFLTLILAFLMVNKQLDLQSFLTAYGRCAAKIQGWYGNHRIVQVSFILGLIAGTVFLGALLAWLLRGTYRRTGLPLLGLIFVTGFILTRAVGFHHMDHMLGLRILSLRLNSILELSGLFIIGFAGLYLLQRKNRTC